ncbi:MAG: hypothetical protein ETSY1_41870 [Candidatus Entotheonella factor]|uniref:Carrier domain-containing protein n=1 Tax=Entotheonella factor TaxID=1429438 RepID=W4L699_ENTF1|nr:MAG: hypothetical protein ETSY1_41870 [Candidatus Entotheonella factor]
MSNPFGTPEIKRALWHLIQQRTPSTWQLDELHHGLSLGEDGGLGLDSVAMVELFVACEDYFGLPFPVKMLEDSPPTVGQLIEHVQHYSSLPVR